MTPNMAGPFALVGFILLGIALLWSRQIIYRHVNLGQQDTMRLVLSLVGNLLILVGIMGATMGSFLLVPFGCVMIPLAALLLVMRYRDAERRALLRCIAVAADKGIPLHHAVRSFASERTDELGYRAALLADALASGMNLPDALQLSKTPLPIDALLAMRLGYETGTLGPAVARIARRDDDIEEVTRSLLEKSMYLGMMVLVMTLVIGFFMARVAPLFPRMFQEFDLQLPKVTQWNLACIEQLEQYSDRIVPLIAPLLLVLLIVLLMSSAHYVGILPRSFPGISLFTRRFDAALVMRSFALAVSYRWPLNKTTWLLARLYPTGGIRRRLSAAGRRIDNGEDWCHSLYRTGIIARADWLVLQAAQRVGNTEWALDELASRSMHRLTYRWRLVINTAFPLILLVFGLVVAFFVVGFFAPLASMIQGLA